MQECAGGCGVAVDEPSGFVEGHAQGDEAGLCPVVQVPLDAAQFGGLDVEDVGAGSCEVFDAADEFGGVRGGEQASAPACVESQGGGGQLESCGDESETEQERGEHHRGGVDEDEGVPVAVAQEPPDEGLYGRAEEAVLDEGQGHGGEQCACPRLCPGPAQVVPEPVVAKEGAGLPVAAGGVLGCGLAGRERLWRADLGSRPAGGPVAVAVGDAAQGRCGGREQEEADADGQEEQRPDHEGAGPGDGERGEREQLAAADADERAPEADAAAPVSLYHAHLWFRHVSAVRPPLRRRSYPARSPPGGRRRSTGVLRPGRRRRTPPSARLPGKSRPSRTACRG